MTSLAISLFRYHRRLVAALVIGVIAGAFAPGHWTGIERPLIGWNVGLWSYLIMLWMMMTRIESAQIREMADREDESAGTVLATVSIATVASLAAIILELATAKGAVGEAEKGMHILFSTVTLFGGWLLLPTLFTIHYARMYFVQLRVSGGGDDASKALRFPDGDVTPDYWDFAYFAFTIAVASQTSDVALAGREIRRVALAQSVLSFFFNLAVMGLSINIAAGLLS